MNALFQNPAEKLTSVPETPGVYLMIDENRNIIYVGKTRNLKKRLAAYLIRAGQADAKTAALVEKIRDFDVIMTDSEKEAFILEANLIKKYSPRYNVILKDDKRYPCLRLDMAAKYPYLSVVRKMKNDGALYFGPYPSSASVNQTLRIIHKTFKIRKCKNQNVKSRTRPCLNYQMNTCLAPCHFGIDPGVYRRIIDEVILFLNGRTHDLVKQLRSDMSRAAEEEAFEKAATLRDKIISLEKTLEKQAIVFSDQSDRDVIALEYASNQAVIFLAMVRGGQLMGMRPYLFQETMAVPDEIMKEFIRQYYEKASFIPQDILVSIVPDGYKQLEESLKALKGGKVTIKRPSRGEKSRLLKLVTQNASQKLRDLQNEDAARNEILEKLQRKLNMSRLPRRIECFDNSNTGGSNAVAAMVVFKDGSPEKSSYRKYRIRTVGQQDDYAYMHEILGRRYRDAETVSPDLLMVDGGKGQLNIALSVLEELNLKGRFYLLGIAKKNVDKGEADDKIYVPGRSNPLNFSKQDKALMFLQQIRDEAHRFVISFHRQKRSRSSLSSSLDAIKGIGPRRKKALLRKFGTVQNLKSVSLEELKALPEMNDVSANAVCDHFKGPVKGGD